MDTNVIFENYCNYFYNNKYILLLLMVKENCMIDGTSTIPPQC